MARPTMTEIMSGAACERSDVIQPTEDVSILAVDVVDQWGAAFRFSIDSRGNWYADCLRARRLADGRWEDIGSGGSRGDGWGTPWRPPAEGWDGEALLALGITGQDIEDDDGAEQELVGVVGFASPTVASLLVEHESGRRTVPVTSPVGAFVVVSVGYRDISLTPLAANGDPLAVTRWFDELMRAVTYACREHVGTPFFS